MLNHSHHQSPLEHSEELARAALSSCCGFYGRNLSVETDGPYLVLRGVVKTAFQREQVFRTVKKTIGNLIPLLNEIEIAVR